MTNLIINILAFAVLTLLWLAFGVALLFNHDLLDTVWQSFRSWPLIIQLVVGLLVLPVVLGLWIWETSWPLWLRLILVAGLGDRVYVLPQEDSQPAGSFPGQILTPSLK